MVSSSAAVGPKLGYLYQIRYALYLLLQQDGNDVFLSIEWLDDVTLASDDENTTPVEFLQLKHSVNSHATLTDLSPQIWNTISNWSNHIADGRHDTSELALTLVTTSVAKENSLGALLRPSHQRDAGNIIEKLIEATAKSRSKELSPFFESFLRLSDEQRLALINNINVLDDTPNIIDIESKIQAQLHGIRRVHRSDAYQKLEGWWFAKVVNHLMEPDAHKVISLEELENKIADIADEYSPDNLPIDFFPATEKKPSIPTDVDTRLFVQQLKAIGISTKYLERCILDYYSAFEQRARWVRKDLIVDGEIEKYERKLIHEWDMFSLICISELGDTASEVDLQKCGFAILNQMQGKDIRIRDKVSEPYVMRGSYHILADNLKGVKPQIQWHPEFLKKVTTIFSGQGS